MAGRATFQSIFQEFRSDIRAAIQTYRDEYYEIQGFHLSEEATAPSTDIVSRIARDGNRIHDYCRARLVELYRFYGNSTSTEKAFNGLKNDPDLLNRKCWKGHEAFLATMPRARRRVWRRLWHCLCNSLWYLATRGLGCVAAVVYWVLAISILLATFVTSSIFGPVGLIFCALLLLGFWVGFTTLFCCSPFGYRLARKANRI